jgi:hypothetical protein
MDEDDVLDLIEEVDTRAKGHGGPAEAARQHRRLAERYPEHRADFLVAAGTQLSYAGDDEAALATYREAATAAGFATPDVRCYLVDGLLRTGRGAEAREVAEAVGRDAPTDPDVFLYIGESFELAGDLPAAARWFTLGVARHQRVSGEDVPDVLDLMIARRRVRQAQSLPEDDDDMYAELELLERQLAYSDRSDPYGDNSQSGPPG